MGVLAKLEEAIEELCGTDPASLGDAEAMVVLHRCAHRLEAAMTRAAVAAAGAVRGRGVTIAQHSRGRAGD